MNFEWHTIILLPFGDNLLWALPITVLFLEVGWVLNGCWHHLYLEGEHTETKMERLLTIKRWNLNPDTS